MCGLPPAPPRTGCFGIVMLSPRASTTTLVDVTVAVRVTSAAAGVPWHSWATTACHGRNAAVKAPVVAAKVMAMTGVQLMQDAKLLAAARKSFDESVKDEPYQSPIPADAKPPLPQQTWAVKFCCSP